MDKTAFKLALKIIIIAAVLIGIAVLLVCAHLAKTLATPSSRMTLEAEKAWAEEHGVWGDLEKYTVEDYTINGKDDYVLHCALVCSDDTKNNGKYVIISHGYNSNRYGAAKYVPIYIDLGYNCIIYDLRGHGENELTVCTIGNYESEDLIKLIDDTYSRYGDDIYLGLHGESMGSSTSLSALKYSPKVHFVVADCGFTNLYELIGTGFKKSHAGFAEPIVDLDLRIFYGYSMKDTSAIDAITGNEVPICFIHGSDDDFIAPSNSSELQKRTSGYSEIHFVDGAAHAQSREILGKAEYQNIVKNFLDIVSDLEKR